VCNHLNMSAPVLPDRSPSPTSWVQWFVLAFPPGVRELTPQVRKLSAIIPFGDSAKKRCGIRSRGFVSYDCLRLCL
jgi:hypothetical protein